MNDDPFNIPTRGDFADPADPRRPERPVERETQPEEVVAVEDVEEEVPAQEPVEVTKVPRPEQEEGTDHGIIGNFAKGAVLGLVDIGEGVADTLDRAIEFLPGNIDDVPGADWQGLKDAIGEDDTYASAGGRIAGRVAGSIALTAATIAAAPGLGIGAAILRFTAVNGAVNAAAFNDTVATSLNEIPGLDAITPDALVIDEDDGYWTRKAKVFTEGLGLGAVFGAAFEGGARGLRSLARIREIKKARASVTNASSTKAFQKLKETSTRAENVRVMPNGEVIDIATVKPAEVMAKAGLKNTDLDAVTKGTAKYIKDFEATGVSTRAGAMNLDKLSAADPTGALYIDSVGKQLAKSGKLARPTKDLPEMLVDLAEQTDNTTDEILVHLANLSGSIDDLPAVAMKAKMSMDMALENLERVSKKFLEQGNRHSGDIQREWSNAANFYRNVTLNFKPVGTGTARDFKALGTILDVTKPIADADMAVINSMWRGKDGMTEAARMINSTGNTSAELIGALSGGAKTLELARFTYLNGLLAHPMTHLKNVSSTAFNSVFLPIKRIAGGLPKAIFSKEARRQVRKDLIQVQSFGDGMGDALTFAVKAYRAGRPLLENTTKLDINPSYLIGTRLDFSNPIMRKGFDAMGRMAIPVRGLVAEDEFFKQFVARSHIRAGLLLQAAEQNMDSDDAAVFAATQMRKMFSPEGKLRNLGVGKTPDALRKEGLRMGFDGVELDDFVAERVKHSLQVNKMGQMKQDAIREAKFASYQQDSPLADNLSDFLNYIPGAFLVQPFVKTPVNLTKWMHNHSIVFRNGIFDELSGAKGISVQHEALGRFMTAGAFWTFVWNKAQAGEIKGSTGGSGNTDFRVTGVARDANMVNNIDIMGVRIDLNLIEPVGQLFAGMATLMEVAQRGDQQGQDLAANAGRALTLALADTMKDRAFSAGLLDFAEAFQGGPDSLKRYMSYKASSFVPSIVRIGKEFQKDGDIRRRIDPTPDNPNMAVNAVTRALLIGRDELPPRRDVFGRVLRDKPKISKTLNDPVIKEFMRLGWAPPKPTRRVTAGAGSVNLDKHSAESVGHTALDAWMEEIGNVKIRKHGNVDVYTALKNMIKSKEYKNASDRPIGSSDESDGTKFGTRGNDKAQMLSSIYSAYKKVAKANMLKRVPTVGSAIDRLKGK